MPARLVVDIWVTSWFLEAPQLPAVEVQGAVVALADSAQHLNDKSGSQPWFGIEREYLVTPTQEGVLQIPAFAVAVKPGPDGKPITLQTQPLTLQAAALVRPAAAGNSLITTQLQLGEKFDRDLQTLKAGDSFTRTVTMSAAGTPAMLLPPIEFAPIDGLGVYPAPPLVANLGDERGGFSGGRRVDSATYVIQKAGRYTLPALEVQWWNPQTQALHREKIAAVHFKAAAGPATQGEFAIPGESLVERALGSGHLLALGAGALILLALYRWLQPFGLRLAQRCRERYAHARQRYENSEPYAYRQLRTAARSEDLTAFYAALCRWAPHLQRTQLNGSETFASSSGDAELHTAITRLEAMLFSKTSPDPTIVATVMKHIDTARHTRRIETRTKHRLQPLNP